MVEHGDDFIVGGCGEDLDWLSENLNEWLELVQKARLGPGYDRETTALNLNRCVTHSDFGLTWEADPRLAELAIAELGLQAARPQTSPGGAKPNALLDHEELESDGQKAYRSVAARLAYLVSDRPDIALAVKECSREVGKATRADLTRLKGIGRYLSRAKSRVGVSTTRRGKDTDATGCMKT